MTTESVPAPHSARTMADRTAIPTRPLRPPRGPARRPAPHPRRRDAARRASVTALLTADLLAALLTPALLPPLGPPPALLLLLALIPPLLHACRGLYRPALTPSALAEVPAITAMALVQWFVIAEALTVYDPRYSTGWVELALAVAVQTALCVTGRAVAHRARRRAAGRRPQPALVIGRGPVARQVTGVLHDHREYGMRPIALIDAAVPALPPASAGGADPGPGTGTLPVLTTRQDVSRAVLRNTVRHAVFTQRPGADPETAALLALLTRHGCRLWLVDGGAAAGGRDHLWGFSVRPLHRDPHRPLARAVKRAGDALLAAVALVLGAPVMAVCALAVRLADGPGVIFRQERVGLHGRPFTLLKFRTLRPASEHESATRWNVAFDRRMSPTGNLLRRTSLDELPQLWNVLRGDMSLVGPRPERPYFVAKFSHAHPGYQARHRMPAGITGLAQINGLRGDTSIEERARFDNHYIDTWSPWQDVCILARTAASLFRFGGS
ncbi:exopolysaccharide biosynthesis polyprenyl glycosylphosphotransferase [Streptomyces sp. CAU 1734]|uniref:exopolysaccharide biosynthesis polyprenyl glycosylphosphotransferase n=1 Tax=Streptomyces sp. CAU 1734 TaxID=3140360 RepID=UPI003260E4C5